MVTGIPGPPNNYTFGENFNYANWPVGSILSLVNVPWNSDYRDVVRFADRNALNAYIDSLETPQNTLDNVTYIKPNSPSVRIPFSFNQAQKFNYLRVTNPLQPLEGGDVIKDYYYFIQGINYIAGDTTEVIIQLDVFQTYIYDVSFGNCYIDRGHIGVANQNASQNNGRDFLTIPEGIDYGGEYQTVARKSQEVISSPGILNAAAVLICSTTDLTKAAGDVTNPQLYSAPGSTFEGLASGATYYIFYSVAEFIAYMKAMQTTPWVTQGIISITIIPLPDRYMPSFLDLYNAGHTVNKPFNANAFIPGAKVDHYYPNWRNDATILAAIPARYNTVKAKFFTYPYMVIEVTTWTGKPIILKPESWNDPDATMVETATFTPPGARVVFRPRRYNAIANSPIDNKGGLSDAQVVGKPANWVDAGDDGGDYLDLTTMIDNFPTMAIVNNGAMSYLASNFASIAYQQQSAAWSQSRALRSNETAYDQSSAGISASQRSNQLGNAGMAGQTASGNEQIAQSAVNQMLGGFAGAGMGVLGAGNPVSAAAAAATGVAGGLMAGAQAQVAMDAANRSNSINQVVSKGQNTIANNQAAYMRDTNKSLADWAARGDYENAIAGVNAQVQGASMIQPSTSGQTGGEAFNLVNGSMEVSLRWKLVDPAAIRTLGDYWLRYGYSVKKFSRLPNTLMVMTKFTYWKLLETYIVNAFIPEQFKQAIRGILEKGVTVWASPTDIGNVDLADNAPLTGITL